MAGGSRQGRSGMLTSGFVALLASLVACGQSGDDLARLWERTPGFWLGGQEASAPQDWSSVNEFRVAKVATYSAFPYVVTVGYVGTPAGLYVMAVPESHWLERVRANPRSRMRIGESTYSLVATEPSDPMEIRTLLEAYGGKYREWIAEYFGVALTKDNLRDYLVPIRFDAAPGSASRSSAGSGGIR